MRAFGDPIGVGVAPRPYTEAQRVLDGAYEKGARNYWSAQNFAGLNDPIPETLVELGASMPTAESDILVCQLGGAINDVAAEATAYPHRSTAFAITPGARWRDPSQDAACIAWVRRAAETLAPHAEAGAYVNFVADAAGQERTAYGPNFERLAALKARVDPANRFRWNQNVPPEEDPAPKPDDASPPAWARETERQ